MLKAKHINRKKVLTFHALAAVMVIAACTLTWAVMGNQEAGASPSSNDENKPLTFTTVGGGFTIN